MKIRKAVFIAAVYVGCAAWACDAAGTSSAGSGTLRIDLILGSAWIHAFNAFTKVPPQFSLWAADESGAYAKTLYATKKIATQGWVFSGGNRRKEALPYWCHQRGVAYRDGLYLPSKEEPLADAISSATPQAAFSLSFDPPAGMARFFVYLEINHSVDFNAAYPKNADPGAASYSGGKDGSGQPALVYRVLVDSASGSALAPVELVGHSSPDGSDGGLDADLSGIDSALDILGGMLIAAN
jgi:hypothetical protein